jgi:hypothetical protein
VKGTIEALEKLIPTLPAYAKLILEIVYAEITQSQTSTAR